MVRGYVKAISPRGCFVSLSRGVEGFIGLKYLSDDFIQADAVASFLPIGSLVVGRALPATPRDGAKGGSGKLLPLTLRRSDLEGGTYVAPAVALA